MEFIEKFKNYLLAPRANLQGAVQKYSASKATVKNYLADVKQFISWVETTYKTPFNPSQTSLQQIHTFKTEKASTLSASSLDRHISSLRKFYTFLKLDGAIAHSPFDQEDTAAQQSSKADPWHLHDFKNFLYVYNASHLTIKNYLIDVKQFLNWAEEVLRAKDAWHVQDKNVLARVDHNLVEEYKQRLLQQHVFSPSSINRKLSSLRKYLSWAAEQGYMQQDISGFGSVAQPVSILENAAVEEKPIAASQTSRQYSKISPIRLFQKLTGAGTFTFDLLITSPVAHLFKRVEHGRWALKGKPLFVKTPLLSGKHVKRFIPHVRNISKDFYAPLSVSITDFPWYKKIFHHLRHTRPSWYRRYHQLALAHYFNWAILIIFSTAIGFGMYNSFVTKPTKSLANLSIPNAPMRVLSFQGRLTDASDNPITSPTWLRFVIYNQQTASGSARVWEEVDKVSPDQDGIFSLLLGSNGASDGGTAALCNGNLAPASPATGACGIPSTVFTQNNALWLGVTVEQTAELAPREQLATVAYASNAESLQGMPPITATSSGTQNVILALNSSGNLAIGASTTFQATSGSFTLSGNTLALNTNPGTNGNIALAPDGLGTIDFQRPLQTSTNNGDIASVPNALTVEDLFAVLATSSGQSAVTINQNGLGPIISASHSGIAEFTLDSSGNGIFNGNITGQTLYTGGGTTYYINGATSHLNSLTLAGSFAVSGNVASDLVPSAGDTYSLGTSASNEWLNLYAKNIYSNGQLLTSYWQENLGALSPISTQDDLLLGATATSSAGLKFGFLNVASGVPTATISSNLSLKVPTGANPASSINLLNGGSLGVYTASTGQFDQGLSATPALYVANNGNIGIGNSTAGVPLDVTGAIRSNNTLLLTSLSGTAFNGNALNNDWGLYNDSGNSNDLTFAEKGGAGTGISTARLIITHSGSVGIDTTSPLTATGLDIEKNGLGNAALDVNQLGLGDILTASASGTTQLKLTNGGNLFARTFTDLDSAAYFLDPASVNTSLVAGGTIGIGTISPTAGTAIDVEKASSQFAAVIVNQQDTSRDIFTASASGTMRFTIQNDGTLLATKYNTDKGLLYLNGTTGTIAETAQGAAHTVLHGNGSSSAPSFSAVDLAADVTGVLPLSNGGTGANLTGDQGGIVYYNTNTTLATLTHGSLGSCLISGGTGAPTWSSCGANGGGGYWTLDTLKGDIYPINATLDLLVGGSATSSAKFAVTGIAGSLTPTASVSATVASGGSGSGVTVGGDGSIQSLIGAPLTLGGTTTGNIILKPVNGQNNGTVSIVGGALDSTFSNFNLFNGVTTTLNFAQQANTINIGTANGTINFADGTIDDTKSSLTLFATPATLTLGNSSSTTTVLGAQTINGNTTLGTNASNTVVLNGLLSGAGVNSAVQPTGNGVTDLGSAAHYWGTVYADNFIAPVGGGTSGYWQLTNSVLAPVNLWNDLAVGGNATSSATFQIFGSQFTTDAGTGNAKTVLAGTASTSANLVFRGASSQINLLNGSGLTIQESGGGDSALRAIVTISNNGDLTLNSGNIITPSSTANIFTTNASTINIGGSSATTDFSGNLTVGTNGTNTLTVNAQVGSSLIPSANLNYNLGSSNNRWNNIWAGNVYLPTAGGTGGYWTLASSVLSPTYNWDDLAVGGTATASATPFQVFASSYSNGSTLNGGLVAAGTATSSGNLAFRGTSTQIDLLNNAALGFYNSVGGDAGLNTTPALYIANSGNIGIGTNSPKVALDVNGSIRSNDNLVLTSSTGTAFNGNASNNDWGIYNDSGNSNDLTFAEKGGAGGGTSTVRFVINHTGSVGINTNSPLTATGLDIEKNALGNAAEVVNQLSTGAGAGDIFTASSSGTPEFTIANDGSIKNSLVPNLIGAKGIDTLYNLGEANAEWDTLYVRQIVTPANGGVAGYWQLTNTGVLYPANLSNDLAIGTTGTITDLNSQATSSAAFHVYGTTQGTIAAGTASTAADLTFNGANVSNAAAVNILNNTGLGFYTSYGGDGGLSTTPSLYIANSGSNSNANGLVGIGTTSPANLLTINQSVSGGEADLLQLHNPAATTNSAAAIIFNLNGGTTGTLSKIMATRTNAAYNFDTDLAFYNNYHGSSTERLLLQSNGGVGINTTKIGNGQLVVNQPNLGGDIFTASASGTTQFTINNNGNVAIGPSYLTAQGILDVASKPTNLPSDLTLGQAAGTNLIPNPSFEGNSTANWSLAQGGTGGSIATSTTTSMFGKYSLLVTTGSAWTEGAYTLTVTPNTTYTFSAWVKTSTANEAVLQFFDHGTNFGTQSSYHTGNGKWQRLSVTATTGASTTTVDVDLFTTGANGSTAYFDGVQLEQASSASPYLDGSLGPGYSWTGAPNNSSSVRNGGAAFAYNTFNSANGLGAASDTFAPTLQLDQNGTGDIIDASASGNTEFQLTNSGNVISRKFTDLDNTSYFLDPAAAAPAVSLAVSGYVGIGTTSPLSQLEVASTISTAPRGIMTSQYSNDTSAAVLELAKSRGTAPGSYTAVQSGDTLGNLQFMGANGSAFANGAYIRAYADQNWTTGAEGSYMAFGTTADGATTSTERLRIDNAGKVGIGNTNPGAPLQITGLDDTGGDILRLTNKSNNGYLFASYNYNGGTNPFAVIGGWNISGGVYANTVIPGGNVGIGTTSPGDKLDVSGGDIYSIGTNTGSWSNVIGIKQGTNINYWQVDNNGNSYFASNHSASWNFAGGSVGIGTTTPGIATLYTYNAGSNVGLYVGNGTPFGQSYIEQDGPAATHIYVAENGSEKFAITSGGAAYFAGNVGIGTSGPSIPLSVQNQTNQTISNGTCYGYLKNSSAPTGQYCGGITQGVSITAVGDIDTGDEFHAFSDERAKNFLENLNPSIALNALMELRPLHFQWKQFTGNGSQVIAGLFAQEVEQVIPEAVQIQQGKWFPDQRSLDYNQLITYSISAIQGLNDISATEAASLQNLTLNNTGDINVTDTSSSSDFTVPHYYTMSDALGNPITQMGAMAEMVVGNLRAGSVQAQQLLTNSLAVATDNVSIAGQSLHDYIAGIVSQMISQQGGPTSPLSEVDQLHTNIISPLSDNPQVQIRLNNSGIEIAKDASSSAVASIDNQGNATFSGQLNSQNLEVNGDATVSGTLHANSIEANSIVGLQAAVSTLSAQNVTNVTNIYFATPSAAPIADNTIIGPNANSSSPSGVLATSGGFTDIASFSAFFAYVPNLRANTAMFDQGLVSLGPTSLADTTIDGQLSIDGTFLLADNSINVLGGDLQLQPLRQGGIAFAGHQVYIDTNGNLSVNGNAIFMNNLAVKTLSPLAGQDLTINLNNGAATGSAQPDLNVKNSSGSAVFAINQLGDLVASGEATFSKLNLQFAQPALAVSDTEVIATGSAGTASINPYQKEVTIDNTAITANSLIYITPVGDTGGQTPYLERQVAGKSFSVGIPRLSITQINFNWLIVN